MVADAIGSFTLLLVFVRAGYVAAKDDIQSWMIWGYYVSPMMYGQNAIAINEFFDKRWGSPPVNSTQPTIGKTLLRERGLYTEEYWFWIHVAALFGFSLLFHLLFIAALTFLNSLGDNRTIVREDDSETKRRSPLTFNRRLINFSFMSHRLLECRKTLEKRSAEKIIEDYDLCWSYCGNIDIGNCI